VQRRLERILRQARRSPDDGLSQAYTPALDNVETACFNSGQAKLTTNGDGFIKIKVFIRSP
jgi:hypothetical protein